MKISGYTDVQSCDTLIRALKDRPISVAVDATSWSGYKTGILVNCGKNVNHGVLLFGVNDNYWSIKNSWGTSWGEQGFIKLAPGNTCAICNYPSYPSLWSDSIIIQIIHISSSQCSEDYKESFSIAIDLLEVIFFAQDSLLKPIDRLRQTDFVS